MSKKPKICKVCNRQDVEFYPNRRVCKGCYNHKTQTVYAQTEKGKAIRHKARKKYDKSVKGVIFRKAYFQKNPQAREARTIRQGCWSFIRRGRAGVKFSRNIGCTAAEYKAYIESQFVLNMSWENYGSLWHIDHILPLNCFDLLKPDQFAAACHYTNTRPLYKTANLRRSRKFYRSRPMKPLHALNYHDHGAIHNLWDYVPDNNVAEDSDDDVN